MNKAMSYYHIIIIIYFVLNGNYSIANSKDKVSQCYEALKIRYPSAIKIDTISNVLQIPKLKKLHLVKSVPQPDSANISKLPISVVTLDINGRVIDQCLAVSSGSSVYDEIWQKSVFAADFEPASKNGIPFISLFVLSMPVRPK